MKDRVESKGCQGPRGTTLIELLVVIVVFMVGILAVAQIFPKGFQLLITSRNNAEATALARDQVEHLKYSPDDLPDLIEAVTYENGVPVVNANKTIFDLGPDRQSASDYVDASGNLWLNGTNVGNWQLHSGANGFRRIIGEGQRVPAPRQIGTNLFGGLRVLANGPIDHNEPLFVYANDMTKENVYPADLALSGTNASVAINGTPYSAPLATTSSSLSVYEYFVGPPIGTSNPTPANECLILPTNPFPRTYHLSLSAFLGTAGGYTRTDLPDLAVTVPGQVAGGFTAPLVEIPISQILQNYGLVNGAISMASVEYDSVRVQPEYYQVASFTTVTGSNGPVADPFQYELLDQNIGVLLFNPIAYQSYMELPGGAREPLIAKVDYDTLDWRILRQEFRIDSQFAWNGPDYDQFEVSVPSILVGSLQGPDGLTNGGLASLETPLPPATTTPYVATQSATADNVMVIDLATGGVLCEVDPNTPTTQLVTVDKNHGIITVHGAPENTSTLSGFILLPGATTPTQMDLTGRTFRVLYRARNNWAAFPTKAASSYSVTTVAPPSPGQVYVPSNPKTRIYFPMNDLHQKVTVDEIFYMDGTTPEEMQDQDFTIEMPVVADGVGLPCIDITTVDPNATALNTTYGEVARGIKGASLTVQVIWNPASFSLSPTTSNNLGLIGTWGQSYRRSTNQTYLQTEIIK